MLQERCQETSLGARGDRELSQMGEGWGCVDMLNGACRAGRRGEVIPRKAWNNGCAGHVQGTSHVVSGWS